MKAHLKAEIGEGMFSGENSVVIEGYYSGVSTLTPGFFEKRFIKDGKLEVEVLEEKGESVFVRLPGRTLEAPGDKGYITVKKENLIYEHPDRKLSIEEIRQRDGSKK
ncbi:hypothetical protein A3K73_02065 [Candidatus Pacearchaeota archaeon RBG_13_36_9]|nr:MAG: hypothetical protein A3K73_02065 [Candidatus Pacearchaeota archaeon RBG_13_36_9]